MNKSVWKESAKIKHFEKLEGEKKCDVLIIGGGLCGILCAHFLKESGVNYILVEGRRICGGTTGNTTAKITFQHGLVYHKLIKDFGIEKAKMYLDANKDALCEYEKLCKNIDCDFEKVSAYTYSLKDKREIEEEVKAVNSLGFNAKFEQNSHLPFETKGLVCFENQAQFDVLKFIAEISRNLNIYENTFVHKIEGNCAFFDGGNVIAKKIIVATHFPFINSHGSYFLKLYQHRSYVCAFENVNNKLNDMYVDEDLKGLSFRSYKDLLLIGEGSHRTGKQGGGYCEIENFVKTHFPDAKLKYRWAAQDCMSLDNVAYIGNYSKSTPNLFVATGFNKWGMTLSMAAAKILCDMVQEKENEYVPVFSPHRSIIKPQLFVNGIETMTNLINPLPRRCSHLGCALKYNKLEHSWDCCCHGSRFDESGRVLENPAMKNINVNKKTDK